MKNILPLLLSVFLSASTVSAANIPASGEGLNKETLSECNDDAQVRQLQQQDSGHYYKPFLVLSGAVVGLGVVAYNHLSGSDDNNSDSRVAREKISADSLFPCEKPITNQQYCVVMGKACEGGDLNAAVSLSLEQVKNFLSSLDEINKGIQEFDYKLCTDNDRLDKSLSGHFWVLNERQEIVFASKQRLMYPVEKASVFLVKVNK